MFFYFCFFVIVKWMNQEASQQVVLQTSMVNQAHTEDVQGQAVLFWPRSSANVKQSFVIYNLSYQCPLHSMVQRHLQAKLALLSLSPAILILKYCDYSPGSGETSCNRQTNDVEKQ